MRKHPRILALLVALAMLVSLCACSKVDSESQPATNDVVQETENAEQSVEETGLVIHVGQAPLVDEPVTLRIGVLCHDDTTEPEATWMYQYIEQILGINIELEYFYEATRDESVSLLMASGDLPDVMIGMGLSSNEIAKYGEAEGMLLDIKPYLNEENAPNLCAIYEETPTFLQELTTDTGHVYSIGGIESGTGYGSLYRMYYNYDLLEAMGYTDVPTTLDEFVQMLRDMKQYGADNSQEIIPFGGNYSRYNATYMILNALGYNMRIGASAAYHGGRETDIALRNGEVVMPAYDREAFPTYLETLRTLYSEGLMEQDFYTIDNGTVETHLSSGMYGLFNEVPGLWGGVEFGSQWWGVIPLTSDYNDTAFWPMPSDQSIGEYVISADTEYPELCVALADYFYGDGAHCLPIYGPSTTQTDILLGFDGWYYDTEEGMQSYAGYANAKDQYESVNKYRQERYPLWYPDTFVYFDLDDDVDENGNSVTAVYTSSGNTVMEIAQYRKSEECNSLRRQFHGAACFTTSNYASDQGYPRVVYFDEETNARVAELKTLIDEYVAQEIAKFVIGERDLSEIDDYFNELQALGAEEYVQYYADYYATLNS